MCYVADYRLDVVQNAWTGEVIRLSASEGSTEDYCVNENLNIPPDRGTEGGVGRSDQRPVRTDMQGESSTRILPQ